jgi:hypothetical protein
MSKRAPGRFERSPRDFYATPSKAVLPLIPHLRRAGIRTFAEPCCGEGDLIRHLEAHGLRCVYAGDLGTGQDALARSHYGSANAIITNPPFTRPVMHALITHFQSIAPTWLLIETDWLFTQQAESFLPHCSEVVCIGRVQWEPGSKHTSLDNYGWARFDVRHAIGPKLHVRGREPIAVSATSAAQA